MIPIIKSGDGKTAFGSIEGGISTPIKTKGLCDAIRAIGRTIAGGVSVADVEGTFL